MVRTCALVERKYDKTKAVVIFDRCEDGFPLNEKEMKEKGWVKLTDETQIL